MYNQKLVASLKANGRILREIKDSVFIPFGCEYSILLKNLNTVRAIINVFIDGEDQTPGGLVIRAGQEIDLERSIKNNNLLEGNRFKFIERTGSVEKHRGIKLEDGLIRVEFQFEKVYQNVTWNQPSIDKRWIPGHYEYDKMIMSGSVLRGNDLTQTYSSTGGHDGVTCSASGSISSGSMSAMNISASSSSYGDLKSTFADTSNSYRSLKANDVGITVAGSKSEQKFTVAGWFPTETEKHTMVFKLLGEMAGGEQVMSPLTVHHKPKCVTCGKQNKAAAKFCTECGTALEIFA